MNTQRTKLVHCHTMIYVYNYTSPKNIPAFSFETEDVQLQRTLLSNFTDDCVGTSFTLNITVEDLPFLQARLDYFFSRIVRSGIQYIAVLDLATTQPCVHLITNRSNKRTNQQLTCLWGNTVTKERLSFNELLTRYATAVQNTRMLTSKYIFTSEQLKKPFTLHNDAADNFLYNREDIDIHTNSFKMYEIFDEQYGMITVTEYKTFTI